MILSKSFLDVKLPDVIVNTSVAPSHVSTVPIAGFCGPTPAASNVILALVEANVEKSIKSIKYCVGYT